MPVMEETPARRTGGSTVAALTLVYEWMHYLAYISYRRRNALFRAPWRTHRLHHYKNERRGRLRSLRLTRSDRRSRHIGRG